MGICGKAVACAAARVSLVLSTCCHLALVTWTVFCISTYIYVVWICRVCAYVSMCECVCACMCVYLVDSVPALKHTTCNE